jgi:citrate synthase
VSEHEEDFEQRLTQAVTGRAPHQPLIPALRHADSLATAIAADHGLSRSTTACRTIARFVIDAYSLARDAADPEAAVDEIFRMIAAAWEAA